MVRFKPEVRIGYLTEPLVTMLQAAALWSYRARVEVEINSINDGIDVHMNQSLHAFDLAIDFDTVGDKQTDLLSLADYLRRALHPQFDVVWEGDHVHVEWDAHRGPVPPPAHVP